jgi:RNA 3'-terminal phosphate cyclase (ATP)
MITIDGSQGEGGGQILRTSLALSLVTGQPFRMEKIRAGRKNPGLLNQHLTCVHAAAAISKADVAGASLGSQNLEFRPGTVTPGNYRFSVGTAGSAALVFQTILPPLLTATEGSDLILEGGTHNPAAPPFDFLQRSFAPVIERMGAGLELALQRPGFFPAGGGRFEARINPAAKLTQIELTKRGKIVSRNARSLISRLSPQIGERELAVVHDKLGWTAEECHVEQVSSSGPGNALLLVIQAENVTAVFTGFGERGATAETVAQKAVDSAVGWLNADVPVEEHLADQLLIPMALAGGGMFRTLQPTLHSRTNAEIIKRFLTIDIRFEQENTTAWRVTVEKP